MKTLWAWIVSALCTVGLMTGTLFYVIPKYVQNNETGYVQFIDKVLNFVKTNWIWLLVVLGVVLISAVALVFVVKTKPRRR